MKHVAASELLDLAGYEQIRERFRTRIIEAKKHRRLAVGPHLTFIFENRDTVLFQVQEMLRTERISDERAIAHELETYNDLIARDGCVSGTLFIEYDEPTQRRDMLERLATLRNALHLRVGERRATARFGTHFGEEMDRIPAVNYVVFELGREAAAALRDPATPAAFEITHPDYELRLDLPRALREELADDLQG